MANRAGGARTVVQRRLAFTERATEQVGANCSPAQVGVNRTCREVSRELKLAARSEYLVNLVLRSEGRVNYESLTGVNLLILSSADKFYSI